MVYKSADPHLLSETRFQSWLTPHQITLIVLWLITTISMIVMLIHGVRGTNRYSTLRHTLHVVYVAALLWHLARTGPSVNQLPELNPQVLPRWKFGAWVPVLGIALMFALTIVSGDGRDILMLLMMAASGTILLAWRRDIRLRSVIQGLTVAIIAYLAGLQLVNNGVISKSWNILMTAFTLPMYVAGGQVHQLLTE